ncbi:MAG: hypothetical protein GWP91_03110 [Rhodobacterales bacterium]|nr:hypothetical protein [Rhodobacterales bacterium]
MSEDFSSEATQADGKKRRRRRRRRRKPEEGPRSTTELTDDVLVASKGAKPSSGPRRKSVDMSGPTISLASSGRNPYRKRNTRPRRGAPNSPATRRRKMNHDEQNGAAAWLERTPPHIVSAIYRGLGGQPGRVTDVDRMIQLTMRALAQPSRISNLIKQMQEKERKALTALLQTGGAAHAEEFRREMNLSFGGHEREWSRVMVNLANKGLVLATPEQDGHFFYVVPEIIAPALGAQLRHEMVLPTFSHPDVRVLDAVPFCPPLHFSITSLATYIDQTGPRLTQRHEIYRHDKEEMDQFFSQIWTPDSELFTFHLDFLMMHGIVELRGEYLSLNRDVMEEWLQLEPEDQRDLLFRALDKRFPMAEWVLWAIHGAEGAKKGDPDGSWVAERPLVGLYRRWKKGADWRERIERGTVHSGRTHERESYSFASLVHAGILEMGQWGQEKFYRLSPRGRRMLEPTEDDGFMQFYLTPSFEIMAPAGLAPILLFRIGELADLSGCDRANTYKITEISIERALERGWRRDDVLQFLRDNSQIGLPDNVEDTLKGWIGHRGDVEFHDLMLITVHRSQIRRIESNKRVKPYILHRFAPGMYAIDRTKRDEVLAVLSEARFSPSRDVRAYPGDPQQVEARQNLQRQVIESREAAGEPMTKSAGLVPPEILASVPGTRVSKTAAGRAPEQPPEVTEPEARMLIEKALSKDVHLEMVYRAKNGARLPITVEAERMAFKADVQVLVGMDVAENERRTFVLDRIERLRLVES